MTASPPLARTQRSLPIALLRAREAVMSPIREMLAASGVNEQKWRVLRVLQERGPLDLTVLAQESCLLLPSLTRMSRAMEADGLITRTTPPDDRRRSVAAITPAGEALIAAHAEQAAAIRSQIEREFGADKLAMLLDLLEELRALTLKGGGQS